MTAKDAKRGGSAALTWVGTLGGPHILVPQSVCPHWKGAPPDYPDQEGDYGRACSVQGYIGLIDVDSAQALVFGDEPGATAFLPERNALVRWIGADSEDDMVEAAIEVIETESVPDDEELTWTVDERLVLFDAVHGYEYIAEEDHLLIDLAPSPYTVRAAYVEHPNAHMILVRFT